MRTLIVLLILCAGLFGYIYFQERHLPSTDEIKKEEMLLFPKLDKDAIIRIEIKKGDKTLVLEKKGDKWLCEEKPVKEYKINSLLSGITAYRYKYKIGKYDSEMSKEYGFDKPAVECQIDTKEASYRVLVGAEVPLGKQKYILLGTEAYVGAGAPFDSQAVDAKSWQEKEKKDKKSEKKEESKDSKDKNAEKENNPKEGVKKADDAPKPALPQPEQAKKEEGKAITVQKEEAKAVEASNDNASSKEEPKAEEKK